MTIIADGMTIKLAQRVGGDRTEFTPAVRLSDIPAPTGRVPVLTHAAAPRAGVALSVDARTLTITAREWRRDGVPIAGETGETYTLLAGDAGKRISCRCTVGGAPIDTPPLYIPVTRTGGVAAVDMLDEDSLRQMLRHSAMTHVAIRSGDWSSASTWDTGTVPGDDDSALIPFGTEVRYDVATPARLDLIRVDGRLRWRRDANTHLRCDTILGDVGSRIRVGDDLGRRIAADRTAIIEFRGDVDIDIARDPRLMSRGLVSYGLVETFGAHRTPFLRTATAPLAGATSVTLASAPTGWRVGDEILIPGTFMWGQGKVGWPLGNVRLPMQQDEHRIITAIDGATVSFADALEHDHDHHNPSVSRTDLQPVVASMARNIVFRTEGGAATARHRRGHVKIAYEGDPNLWDAAFISLGRTFKGEARDVDSPGDLDAAGNFQPWGDTSFQSNVLQSPTLAAKVTADVNLLGRYPCNVYRTGFDPGNGLRRGKALHTANLLVRESPSWGLVHAGCLLRMWGCVAHDFQAAGIVGAFSDETGFWANCYAGTARNVTGGSVKTIEDGGSTNRRRNYGFGGYGFFFHGRAVKTVNCVVSGCNFGVAFWNRYAGHFPYNNVHAAETLELMDIQLGNAVSNVDYPINHLKGMEVFGCYSGCFITKPGPNHGHEAMIIIEDWKAWSVTYIGFANEYVGNYILKRFDCVAPAPQGNYAPYAGVSVAANTVQVFVVDARTQGWRRGIEFEGGFTPWGPDGATQEVIDQVRVDNPRYGVIGHISINDGVSYALNYDPTTGGDALYSATIPPLRAAPAVFEAATTTGNGNAIFTAKVEDSLTDLVGDGRRALPAAWNDESTSLAAVDQWIARNGYWTIGSDRVAVVPRYYADHITGELTVAAHVVNRGRSPLQGEVYGSIARLPAPPAHAAPPALRYRLPGASGSILIDVAADLRSQHGYDAAGLYLSEGFYGAKLGVNEVRDPKAGTVLYRPLPGVSGADEMTFFLHDRKGNYYRLKAFVEIG